MSQVSGVQIRFTGDTTGLEQAVSRAEGSLNSFQKTASNVVPGNFGSKVQNAAYQIQDFAVQVSSGTAATKAFAQQAPQLLSGFGAVGAVLGTVLAIAVPLAGSFLASSDAAGKLGTALSTVAPYAVTATAALAGFYAPSLLAGIATTTSAIGTGLVGAIRGVTAAMMANPLGLLVAGVAAAAVAIFAFRDDIKKAIGIDFVAIIKESVNFTIRSFVNLKDVVVISFKHLGDIVGGALVGTSNLALRTIASLVSNGMNVIIDGINKVAAYTGMAFEHITINPPQFPNSFADGAAEAGREIGQAMAQNAATDYVGEMGKLASSAMSKVGELFSGGAEDASGKGKKKGADNSNAVAPSQEPGTYFTDRLKAIQDEFKTEQELKQAQYEEDQLALQNAFNNKLVSEQEYYDLSKKLAEKYQADISGIQKARLDGDLSAASSFFGSMASAAQSGGKRLLKVAKAMAAAQAIVDTIKAAVSAMNDPTAVTLPQKLANYATVFAQGMSAVAAIKAVSDGGGGGGGGGMRGGGGRGGRAAAAAGGGTAAAAAPTTTFSFTLTNDPMGFGEKFARQFIDQLNATQRNGGQIRGVIA